MISVIGSVLISDFSNGLLANYKVIFFMFTTPLCLDQSIADIDLVK